MRSIQQGRKEHFIDTKEGEIIRADKDTGGINQGGQPEGLTDRERSK